MLGRRTSGFKDALQLKKSGLYLAAVGLLFFTIGLLTTVAPAYRLSSETIARWTSDIESSTFLYLIGTENRSFQGAFPADKPLPKVSSTLFQIVTNIKPNDPKSLLGHELPGFSSFGSKIIVAGEGTDYASLSIESSPPLDEVLKDRQAVIEEETAPPGEKKETKQTTGDRKVVFIYNSHNRESFMPQLPEATNANQAYHKKVNISKASERFEKVLNDNGIGTNLDKTDFMSILNQRGWGYWKSYQASRSVVKEAVATNKELQYIFDIHRDSLPRKLTTKKINGKDHARFMFVVGADHPNYEKNLKLATKLHYLIDAKYKGLSKGVIQKAGTGTDGIFNQDLSGNAVLVEIGGYDNSLEEVYQSVDILGDVFSTYYWDAEKVSGQ